MKLTATSRKSGADHQSEIDSRASIQAAEKMMRYDPAAFQSPAAATNDNSLEKGKTWRHTYPMPEQAPAVGPLGLWSK